MDMVACPFSAVIGSRESMGQTDRETNHVGNLIVYEKTVSQRIR